MILAIALMMTGCSTSIEPGSGMPTDGNTGVLVLKLTDAQLGNENITGVYIGITRIDVNKSRGKTLAGLQLRNMKIRWNYLLELTGGSFALLGEFELTAGTR